MLFVPTIFALLCLSSFPAHPAAALFAVLFFFSFWFYVGLFLCFDCAISFLLMIIIIKMMMMFLLRSSFSLFCPRSVCMCIILFLLMQCRTFSSFRCIVSIVCRFRIKCICTCIVYGCINWCEDTFAAARNVFFFFNNTNKKWREREREEFHNSNSCDNKNKPVNYLNSGVDFDHWLVLNITQTSPVLCFFVSVCFIFGRHIFDLHAFCRFQIKRAKKKAMIAQSAYSRE